jgi:hypothetical protein
MVLASLSEAAALWMALAFVWLSLQREQNSTGSVSANQFIQVFFLHLRCSGGLAIVVEDEKLRMKLCLNSITMTILVSHLFILQNKTHIFIHYINIFNNILSMVIGRLEVMKR